MPVSDIPGHRSLAASYRHCRAVARRSSSNFWYAFFLLPREKRRAMYALYAFLRQTDDLGDNPNSVEARRVAIRQWREQFEAAVGGRLCEATEPKQRLSAQNS